MLFLQKYEIVLKTRLSYRIDCSKREKKMLTDSSLATSLGPWFIVEIEPA